MSAHNRIGPPDLDSLLLCVAPFIDTVTVAGLQVCKRAGFALELLHLGKRIRELPGVAGLLNVFSMMGEHGLPMKF